MKKKLFIVYLKKAGKSMLQETVQRRIGELCIIYKNVEISMF